MSRTKVICLASILILLCALPAAESSMADRQSKSQRAGVKPLQPDFTPQAQRIESMTDQLVARSGIPGLSMVIVQNGKVISARGYGVTQAGTADSVKADTVFRLASLSKAFAATITGKLVEQGALTWDTPIASQLPAFKLRDYQRAQQVTVRDVLSHRVGLAHNTYDRDLEANQPYQLLAEKLSEAPLQSCEPSECYGYQNIAFSLIGDVVFAASGDFYSHQVEKQIFHPLGMNTATFGRDELMASSSWARPHVRRGGAWIAVTPRENYYHVPPAAGVNASAQDMGQWLLAQLGHYPDVLSKDLINQIHTPQVSTPGEMRGSSWRRERLINAYYGLGWRVFDYQGNTMVFHGGAVQGYRSAVALLPEKDLGVAIMWNSESAAPSGLIPTVLDRALNLPQRGWIEEDMPVMSDEAAIETGSNSEQE
jgi:beta-lactamase class C